ncbi:MAG: hypothetical protein MJK13_13845 [Pseudomonadales bacterium]|nr:hypothetical protein [Pseudomonadales bacterium]
MDKSAPGDANGSGASINDFERKMAIELGVKPLAREGTELTPSFLK